MRCMERNRRQLWLSKYAETELRDSSGLGTGEYVSGWAEPVSVLMNASAPTGDASSSPFGTDASYDLTLVAGSNEWGIEEGDRMWLRDSKPDVTDKKDSAKDAYDVRRVSPSLNLVAFGLSKSGGN